jgi:hypothetical protein
MHVSSYCWQLGLVAWYQKKKRHISKNFTQSIFIDFEIAMLELILDSPHNRCCHQSFELHLSLGYLQFNFLDYGLVTQPKLDQIRLVNSLVIRHAYLNVLFRARRVRRIG